MIVLIIIGVLLFILALVNWEQSQGFFRDLFSTDKNKISSSETDPNSNNQTVYDFSYDEDYAYDDDNDYCFEL